MIKVIIYFFFIFSIGESLAQDLVINAVEYGIAKFHRHNNKLHPYSQKNVWKNLILPETSLSFKTEIQKNSENNYTIFFTNLESMIEEATQLSLALHKKIEVLNITVHGVPGGMWVPQDTSSENSYDCYDWLSAAQGSDEENYGMYYSELSKDMADNAKSIGDLTELPNYQCLSGIKEWKNILAKNTSFKTRLNDNAQLHFLSCLIGYGPLGENFTEELAKDLFNSEGQQIQTALKFGIGDWSIPEGMSFWDYLDDQQVERDNLLYQSNKKDSEIMQKGNILVAIFAQGQVELNYLIDQDFMFFEFDTRPLQASIVKNVTSFFTVTNPPQEITIPGTKFKTSLK